VVKSRPHQDLGTRIIGAIASVPRGLRALVRTWQGRVIVAIVGTQLLIPLHYYLVRKDRHDERFAWRMFSPMRMARCEPAFRIDGNPLSLAGEFHEAWIEAAERGRFTVIEAMAARLCDEHPGSAVRVNLECTYLDRPAETFGGFDMCEVPLL
jgi:hypothetical protein